MGTETTISIAFIIAAVGFFITIYNFNNARKKDTLSEAARMEEIKTACLKANMKLDEVCTRLTFSSQEVLPDTDYNTLSSVTVNAIPMTETDNSYGGKTLTIGA